MIPWYHCINNAGREIGQIPLPQPKRRTLRRLQMRKNSVKQLDRQRQLESYENFKLKHDIRVLREIFKKCPLCLGSHGNNYACQIGDNWNSGREVL